MPHNNTNVIQANKYFFMIFSPLGKNDDRDSWTMEYSA